VINAFAISAGKGCHHMAALAQMMVGEHDIMVNGWAEVDGGSITIAVHPQGAVDMLEPKEKRTYPLADVTGWHANGASVLLALEGGSDSSQRTALKLLSTAAR
jgi:hypothetical protein